MALGERAAVAATVALATVVVVGLVEAGRRSLSC
jgi:hypothetical protein